MSADRIRLNVGGRVFETTTSTLSSFPGSFFDALVSDRWNQQDEVFIDRDPEHFRLILNYMRGGKLHLPQSTQARQQLLDEMDFYGLQINDTGDKPISYGCTVKFRASTVGEVRREMTCFGTVHPTGVCCTNMLCGSCPRGVWTLLDMSNEDIGLLLDPKTPSSYGGARMKNTMKAEHVHDDVTIVSVWDGELSVRHADNEYKLIVPTQMLRCAK